VALLLVNAGELANLGILELVNAILKTSLDLILVTDRKGNLGRVSPSSLATIGYRPDEMIGHNAIRFANPNTQLCHPFVVGGDAQEDHAGLPFQNGLRNGPDFLCALPITPSYCRVVEHLKPTQTRRSIYRQGSRII